MYDMNEPERENPRVSAVSSERSLRSFDLSFEKYTVQGYFFKRNTQVSMQSSQPIV